MERIKRKVIAICLMLIVVLGMSLNVFAESNDYGSKNSYDINTLKELKNELNKLNSQEVVTNNQREQIFKNVDPEVVEAFVEEKSTKAVELLSAVEPDEVMKLQKNGVYFGRKEVNLGDGAKAIVEFEDGEEKGFVEKFASVFIEPVYAAENGETKWKGYGGRYFTAKVTTMLGAGYCDMILETHYKLSDKGIDANKEATVADARCLSASSSISEDEPVWTDEVARKIGASDINVYCKYRWTAKIQLKDGSWQIGNGNYRINATVGFVDINKSSHLVKVKHSWRLT